MLKRNWLAIAIALAAVVFVRWDAPNMLAVGPAEDSIVRWQAIRQTGESYSGAVGLHRARVQGGWLVSSISTDNKGAVSGKGLTFIPDPQHTWQAVGR